MERSHEERKIEVLLLDLPRHIEGFKENLVTLIRKQEKLMSQVDDLNNGLAALATAAQNLDASVQAAVVWIGQQGPLPAAVATAITSIGNVTSKFAADASELTAAIPGTTTVPPPAPAPAPPAPTPVAAPVVLASVTVTAPQATPPATPAAPPTSGGTAGQ